MATPHLYGIPYVPGRALGKLQRHINRVTEQDILLLRQHELSLLSTTLPAGLIVIEGAPYSHNLIQFLGIGIPVVIISAPQSEQLISGNYLHINGYSGEINAANPTAILDYQPPSAPPLGQPIATVDGTKVYLNASASSAGAATLAVSHGAAAVGLVRSEFLQSKGERIPDTHFYQQAFSEVCDASIPLNVTIRLLDLAPDKSPSWLYPQLNMQESPGLQGVRLYHIEQVRQVVCAQLAAIDTLASKYKIRLIIPYVTTSKEFLHWSDIINSLISPPIGVGAMLETPASVLAIDHWLTQADFVSIGCNDLMQSFFAADRELPQLKHYLNPYTPALLRFFQQIANDAGDQIFRIQLCGLLPQWPAILPILVTMGFTNYSIEPAKIPYLAQSVCHTNVERTRPLVEQVCHASSAEMVCQILNVPPWPDS